LTAPDGVAELAKNQISKKEFAQPEVMLRQQRQSFPCS
jgi:hypothetical protein